MDSNFASEDKVVCAWIAMQYAHAKGESFDDLLWSSEVLDSLCDRAPDALLSVLVQILAKDPSDFIAANLGAGPLEDLLARRGEVVIAKVERLAADNSSFAKALSGVWRNTIATDVWERILALRVSVH